VLIHVALLATFRLAAGVKSFDLDLPTGTNLLQAVLHIVECYPTLRPHWLDQSGELHAHVHIFYNGEDAALLPAGLSTALQPGDALEFFPPVAGG
jgi:molybdopterin synthase sulfur carrier subunit